MLLQIIKHVSIVVMLQHQTAQFRHLLFEWLCVAMTIPFEVDQYVHLLFLNAFFEGVSLRLRVSLHLHVVPVSQD